MWVWRETTKKNKGGVMGGVFFGSHFWGFYGLFLASKWGGDRISYLVDQRLGTLALSLCDFVRFLIFDFFFLFSFLFYYYFFMFNPFLGANLVWGEGCRCFCFLFSVFCFLLSVFCFPLSAFRFPLSAFRFLLSVSVLFFYFILLPFFLFSIFPSL